MLLLSLKALHIIAIIAWMAGLLYLPRLYVYRADASADSGLDRTLEVMSVRLRRVIMVPAMLASWVLGIWLAIEGGFLSEGWFHAKLLAVILLTGFHFFLAHENRSFAPGAVRRSARYYRIANEIPTVLMIVIVFLAVTKPF